MNLFVWFRSLQIMDRNYFFVSFCTSVYKEANTRPHTTLLRQSPVLTNSFPFSFNATVCRHRRRLRYCSKYCSISLVYRIHFIKLLTFDYIGQSMMHFMHYKNYTIQSRSITIIHPLFESLYCLSIFFHLVPVMHDPCAQYVSKNIRFLRLTDRFGMLKIVDIS